MLPKQRNQAKWGHVPDIAENDWEYDVATRVANAINTIGSRNTDLAVLLHLRHQVRDIMGRVKMTELSSAELIALLAIMGPANGRRLIAETVEESLRPVLRLIGGEGGVGVTAPEFGEEGADLYDQVASGDSVNAT